jgi:hypothetical protein
MVWKGIQVQDVMQQAGFCAVGHRKFSQQDLILLRANIHATNQQKTLTIPSQPPQLILIHPMDDFGWSGRGSKCRM